MELAAALAALLILPLLAACSSSSSSSATATPSVCDQKDAVQQSLTDLANTDVVNTGTDGLTAAIDNVKTDLDQLKTSAQADLQPQIDSLENAASDAKDTLSNLGNDASVNQKIDAVQQAITGVVSASNDLVDNLQSKCP